MSGGGGGRPAYLRSAPIRRLRHPLDESPAWALIGACLWGLLGLTLALPLLIILAVVLPTTFVLRWFLLMLYWNRQRTSNSSNSTNNSTSGGLESMRGNDSRWLGSSWHCSVLHAVLVFETPLEVSTLQQLLLSRVVPVYPRLMRRPVSLPLIAGAGYCWLPDCNFSIENHVFPGPNMPSTETQVQEYVSQLLQKGLSNDKPPWELHVLRQCAVLRVHQSVADGTSLVKLLCHCLADTKLIANAQNRRRPLSFYCDVIRACLLGPLSLVFWLLMSSPDYNLLTQANTDGKGGVKVTWSAAISFAKVTRVKQVTRSTVNCVLLSALSGALRCLLQNCGVRQPPDLKVLLPVDLRRCTHSASTRLGNKIAPVVISLPVGMEGAVPRLWSTRRTLNTLKRSTDPVVVYVTTTALMSLLPGHFARKILSHVGEDKASLQFSSQIGPTSNLMMGGCALKSVYALLPAQSHLNVAVSVFTYGDQLFVTVATDNALGPAGNIILHHLHAQIDLLYNLLKYRRVPGEMKSDTNVYRFPDVTRSPVREIAYRLNHVQEEVQRLSRHEMSNESEKLQRLKAEFSHLLRELRKRKSSSSPEQDLDLWDYQFRSRRRSMSCSFSRRSSATLLNILSTNRPVSYIETSNTSILSPSLTRMTSPVGYKLQQQQQKQGRRNTTSIVDGIPKRIQLPNDICYRRTSTPVFRSNERLTEITECTMCHETQQKHLSQSNLFRMRFGQRNFVKSYSQPISVNETKNDKSGSYMSINKTLSRNFRSQPIVRSFDTTNLDNNQLKNIRYNRQDLLADNFQMKKQHRQNRILEDNGKIYYTNHKYIIDEDKIFYNEENRSKLVTEETEQYNDNNFQCNSRCECTEECCFLFSDGTNHHGINRGTYKYEDSCCNPGFNLDEQHINEDRNYDERGNCSDNHGEMKDMQGSGLYDEILNVIKDNKPLTNLYSCNVQNNTRIQNYGNNYTTSDIVNKTNTAKHGDIQYTKFNTNEENAAQLNLKLKLNERYETSHSKNSFTISQKEISQLDERNVAISNCEQQCCTSDSFYITENTKAYHHRNSDPLTNNHFKSSYSNVIHQRTETSKDLSPHSSTEQIKDTSINKKHKKQQSLQVYDTAIQSLSNFANKIHIFSNNHTDNYSTPKNYTKLQHNDSLEIEDNLKDKPERCTTNYDRDYQTENTKSYTTCRMSPPTECQMACCNCNCTTGNQKEMENTRADTLLLQSNCKNRLPQDQLKYVQQYESNSSFSSSSHYSNVTATETPIIKKNHNRKPMCTFKNLSLSKSEKRQDISTVSSSLQSFPNICTINSSRHGIHTTNSIQSPSFTQINAANSAQQSSISPCINTISLPQSSESTYHDMIQLKQYPLLSYNDETNVSILTSPPSLSPQNYNPTDSSQTSSESSTILSSGIYRTRYRNSMDKLRTLQGSIDYNMVNHPNKSSNSINTESNFINNKSLRSSNTPSVSHQYQCLTTTNKLPETLKSTLAFDMNTKPNKNNSSCDNTIKLLDGKINKKPIADIQSQSESFLINSFSNKHSFSSNSNTSNSVNNKSTCRPSTSTTSSFNNYDKVTFI